MKDKLQFLTGLFLEISLYGYCQSGSVQQVKLTNYELESPVLIPSTGSVVKKSVRSL